MSSASLPLRQSSQRRSSPEQLRSTAQTSSSSPSIARTDDIEPVVLQQPHEAKKAFNDTQEHEQTSDESPTARGNEASGAKNAGGVVDNSTGDEELRKCWICFADASEDTPETSPWRYPCPCALIAHEECLLDWIADMEAPNRTRDRPNGGRIECPQCKAEIKLERPRSLLVDAIRNMENVSARLVTPGALTVLFSTLYQTSVSWGIHSIYAVFGAQEGFKLLKPLLVSRVQPHIASALDTATAADLSRAVLNTVLNNLVHWRLYVGVPLIAPILILSRAHFGDTLLPTLPIIFFATQTHASSDLVHVGRWPPSAPFAFAMLPYVRAVYNYYYHIIAGRHEQRWLREIQPRAGQEEEEGENAEAGENPVVEGDDGNMFEIRIDGWEDWDEEDQEGLIEEAERMEREIERAEARERQNNQQRNNNNAAPEDPLEAVADMQLDGAQAAPPAPQAAQAAPVGPADDNEIIARERRLSFSPTAIAETVIGAILFPTIAGFSGDVLKFILPRSWTAATTSPAVCGAVRRGFLQERWGRTIVGGCIFVVLKDAVMLYVRWKMAQMHRQRRILDFDRSKGGKVGSGQLGDE